ncbi:MAG TPA: class I SAM-dependent methyltransferase family protein [Actinocatenispora sp.]
MGTDWQRWHDGYDDPSSDLARRLAAVAGWVRRADPTRLVSICAGQGYDVLAGLAGSAAPQRISGRLVELDEANVAAARAGLAAAGLTGIEVVRGDAGTTDAYAGAVPADLVLACGVFGNVSDADIRRTVDTLPAFCTTGATVLWTRHRRAPDRTGDIRSWFAAAGFAELDFVAPDDALFSVGVARWPGPTPPLPPGRRLFTFTH